jgi:predicted DNA-binding transcriptional regulator AlpA
MNQEAKDTPPRLALRIDEIATAIGVSRRTIERERSAGRFPAPDRMIGRAPLWRPSTLEAWLSDQSRN